MNELDLLSRASEPIPSSASPPRPVPGQPVVPGPISRAYNEHGVARASGMAARTVLDASSKLNPITAILDTNLAHEDAVRAFRAAPNAAQGAGAYAREALAGQLSRGIETFASKAAPVRGVLGDFATGFFDLKEEPAAPSAPKPTGPISRAAAISPAGPRVVSLTEGSNTMPTPAMGPTSNPRAQQVAEALGRMGLSVDEVANAKPLQDQRTVNGKVVAPNNAPGTYKITNPLAGDNSYIRIGEDGKRHIFVAGDPEKAKQFYEEKAKLEAAQAAEAKKAEEQRYARTLQNSLLRMLGNERDPARAQIISAAASLAGTEVQRMNAETSKQQVDNQAPLQSAQARETAARADREGAQTRQIITTEAQRAQALELQKQIAAEADPKKRRELEARLAAIQGKQPRKFQIATYQAPIDPRRPELGIVKRPVLIDEEGNERFIEPKGSGTSIAGQVFEEGKAYVDAQGNKVIFRNGKFEPLR